MTGTQLFILVALITILAGAMFLAGWLWRAIKYPDMMTDIVDFHEKFKLEYDGGPRIMPDDLFDFRFKFMHEELAEYAEEQERISLYNAGPIQPIKIDQCLEMQLDALVDLVYVTLGTAYLQFGGKNFKIAWNRVQEANMAKVRCERPGDSKRGSTFDVIKPAGWTAPSHMDLIQQRHAS
jgi:predicted HAD superfamily Cof-like phosphohydrolase